MLLEAQCGEIFVVYGMQIRPKYRCIMYAYVYSNKWLKLYLFMQINKGGVTQYVEADLNKVSGPKDDHSMKEYPI